MIFYVDFGYFVRMIRKGEIKKESLQKLKRIGSLF